MAAAMERISRIRRNRFKKMTLATTILMKASMVISRVMLWWRSLTARQMAMRKNRFSNDTPIAKDHGYKVRSTKFQASGEKSCGGVPNSPPISAMAAFQIVLARPMENPPKKLVTQSGMGPHLL